MVDYLVKLQKKGRENPGLFKFYGNFNITERPDLKSQFHMYQHLPLEH